MSFKLLSVFENVALLLKKYNEQTQNQHNNIYRILEVKRCPSTGHSKLIVQVVGKSSIFEATPQEIVAVDNLLEGFSKKDVRAITYLACEQLKKPKYKIVIQEFCETYNKMKFKLKRNNEEVVKTASQIIKDKKLINDLNKEDVSSISYIAGYEHSMETFEVGNKK